MIFVIAVTTAQSITVRVKGLASPFVVIVTVHLMPHSRARCRGSRTGGRALFNLNRGP